MAVRCRRRYDRLMQEPLARIQARRPSCLLVIVGSGVPPDDVRDDTTNGQVGHRVICSVLPGQ
jgi:hypothetical protein